MFFLLTHLLLLPQSQLTPEQKHEDLLYLAESLQRIHPNPYRVHPEPVWEATVAEVAQNCQQDLLQQDLQDDFHFYAALLRVTALAADGHTLLLPWPALQRRLRTYPLRLRRFSDGLFIMSAAPALADFVGARVQAISDVPTEEAVQRLLPFIAADNAHAARLQAPNHLTTHSTLAYLGLTTPDDQVTLSLQFEDGEQHRITLPSPLPTPTSLPEHWIDIERDALTDPPLWLAHRQRNYWFEHIESHQTLYLQFNTVLDSTLEPFSAFCTKLFRFLDDHPIQRLVIDLRHNGGGNNYKNQPLIHGIIRSPKLRATGTLYVLTSPRTFSAAMNCAADLERNTQALFIGEPTGSGPNLAGDSETHTLPHSRIILRISTLWWQGSDPRDQRRTIHPDLPVPLTFAAYTQGEDPALDLALTHEPDPHGEFLAPNTRWQRDTQGD